jgi:uncharacterized protein YkwD
LRQIRKSIIFILMTGCLATILCGCLFRTEAIFSEQSGLSSKTISPPSPSSQLSEKSGSSSATNRLPSLSPGLTPVLTPIPTPAQETLPKPSTTPKPTLTRAPALSMTPKPTFTPAPTKKPTSTPTPALTPTPAPVPTTSADLTPGEWRAELFQLTNQERTKAGKSALEMGSSGLLQAAGIRSEEIVTHFSHTRPDGSVCFSVLAECGVICSAKGENIAMATTGYRTSAQIMQMWMDSPGHRDNILSSSFTSLGIGYCRANGCDWFVQLFIG